MDLLNKFKKVVKHNFKDSPSIENPYSNGNNCLKIIVDNWDIENQERYNIFAEIIKESQKYTDPLHYLACAYACHYSKVEWRKTAIEYFEKYLLDPVPCSVSSFPLYIIYSDLGTDYEAEYDFNNAEKCYKSSIDLQTRHYHSFGETKGQCDAFPQEIKLGRLYLKIGTQCALDYWKSLMEYEEYKKGNPNVSGFRHSVDVEYRKALEKHKKGYVYKPRNKRRSVNYD